MLSKDTSTAADTWHNRQHIKHSRRMQPCKQAAALPTCTAAKLCHIWLRQARHVSTDYTTRPSLLLASLLGMLHNTDHKNCCWLPGRCISC
jgi:hypothetical protein